MAVIRISKTKNYTVMSNNHLRDKNLSLKAKGLLSIMLSLSDDWHYSVRGLASICKEGITSISSTLKELEQFGYMQRHQPIADGKFQEIEYIIFETPQQKQGSVPSDEQSISDLVGKIDGRRTLQASCSDNPYTEFPCTENPYTGNPDTETVDTDITDTEIVDTDVVDTDSADTENSHTQFANTQTPHAYKRKSNQVPSRLNTRENNYQSINPAGKSPMMDGLMEAHNGVTMFPGTNTVPITPDKSYALYRSMIMTNIGFEDLCMAHPRDKSTLEGIVDIMVDAVCSTAPTIRIDQQDIPQSVVKSRLLKLDYSNIEYVLLCFDRLDQKITRIDRYLLTMLYKSASTQDAYYSNWVKSDMGY